MSADTLKKNAALAAAKYVQDGMLLGLGTGSTAAHLVTRLGEMVREGLSIRAIPTSEQTKRQALEVGIELVDPDESSQIDLVIDGADEVDPLKRLIKGGGGALLREKIIAGAGKKMIVIADESKKVTQLGQFPLPVEIDRFSWPLTMQAIRGVLEENDLGTVVCKLRAGSKQTGGGVFLSDGGNYIVDIQCGRIFDPEKLDRGLRAIPGVVETGLFLDLAKVIIYGKDDGVEIIGD